MIDERRNREGELLDAIILSLKNSQLFSKIEKPVGRSDIIVDLLATAKPGIKPHVVAFELKTRPIADKDIVLQAAKQRAFLKTSHPEVQVVLVVAGQLTEQAKTTAIELDIPVVSSDLFLQGSINLPLQQLINSIGTIMGFSPEDKKAEQFIQSLRTVPTGTLGWFQFQKLTCDIFEYLFCPPLDPPKYENPDASKKNRRDMIFSNPCENGFWASVRRDYEAHYIVVDAKNYGTRIQKRAVIEIAHYLKSYGCGLFGIIVSRIGIARSGDHAAREQWIASKKMIITLSDGDIVEMLRMKSIGNRPDELLRSKITEFRVSL